MPKLHSQPLTVLPLRTAVGTAGWPVPPFTVAAPAAAGRRRCSCRRLPVVRHAAPFRGRDHHALHDSAPGGHALLVGSRITANFLLRLHRWSFRFAGLTDAVRVGLAGLLGTGLWICAVYFLEVQGPPRSTVVMEFLLSTVVMGLVRYSPRLAWMYVADRRRTQRETALRTVILGAGATGDMLLRDLVQSHEHGYRVVGFLDDDEGKWGTILGGRPVLGGVAQLPELVERIKVEAVLIAIPRLPAQRVRDILSLCAKSGVRFKILPVSFAYLNDRVSASMLQDLSPEDLLRANRCASATRARRP